MLSPLQFCWFRASGDGQPLRQLAWLDADGLQTGDSEGAILETILARHPEAVTAVEGRRSATAPLANGHIKVVIPFFIGHKLDSLLVAECRQAPSPEQQDGIFCFLHFYANYLSLLDYGELDALTGLFNRKTFDEAFEQSLSPGAGELRPGDRQLSHRTNFWLAVLDTPLQTHLMPWNVFATACGYPGQCRPGAVYAKANGRNLTCHYEAPVAGATTA